MKATASTFVLCILHCACVLAAEPPPPASGPSDIADLKQLEARTADAIRKSLPAVVAVDVRSEKDYPKSSHFLRAASGVIIRPDGLILSQSHVSHVSRQPGRKHAPRGPGARIEVALQDGRRLQAELLGHEPLRDMSLLKIVEPGVYPHVELAKPKSVAPGDHVLKLGHPFGYRPSRGATARLGRVLYMGKSLEIVADTLTFAGDSGGPLINLDGQLIGILENAAAPQLVIWSFPERSRSPMGYASVESITRLMPAMLDPPRDVKLAPDFKLTELPEYKAMIQERRKELYGDEDAKVIPIKDWTQGQATRARWNGLAARYRDSIVEVLGERRRVAYGTVVGPDGWVLTKASEIPDHPRCKLPDGRTVAARVAGTDPAYDLALLKVEAQGLRAVEWRSERVGPAGRLLAAPDGHGGTIGVGIVSVAQRALEGPFPDAITRSKEYVPKSMPPQVLGKVIEGKGILIRRVKDGAAAAGIVPGDLLVTVNGQPVRNHDDVDKCIENKSPGDAVPMVIERAGQPMNVSVKLDEDPYIRCPAAIAWYRNLRADDFPNVFEHDIPLLLDECGGPVIDLDGKAVGVTIARVGQHGCMAIPGEVMAEVVGRLKGK